MSNLHVLYMDADSAANIFLRQQTERLDVLQSFVGQRVNARLRDSSIFSATLVGFEKDIDLSVRGIMRCQFSFASDDIRPAWRGCANRNGHWCPALHAVEWIEPYPVTQRVIV